MKLKYLCGILILFLFACNTASADTHYNYDTGFNCADGTPMVLENNDNAHCGTYEEIINFIQEDTTDEIDYSLDSFNCVDFSQTLHDNSEAAGIKCAVVFLRGSNGFPHATVAYPLNEINFDDPLANIDYVYIEPQSDGVARVEIGEKYQVWKIGENDYISESDVVIGMQYTY